MTELELNRVDIRVGLSGALYFMDGSPQAVRQLRNLVSQVFFFCHGNASDCFSHFYWLLKKVAASLVSLVCFTQSARNIEELVENTIS